MEKFEVVVYRKSVASRKGAKSGFSRFFHLASGVTSHPNPLRIFSCISRGADFSTPSTSDLTSSGFFPASHSASASVSR